MAGYDLKILDKQDIDLKILDTKINYNITGKIFPGVDVKLYVNTKYSLLQFKPSQLR